MAIDFAPAAVHLAVRDDGRPLTAPAEPGHGLLGLHERVSAFGGALAAGPRPEGGFELLATLPLVTP